MHIVLFIFLTFSVSHAYLVQGVHSNVTITSSLKDQLTVLSIEGSDTLNFKKILSSKPCLRDEDTKWFCSLEEIPGYVRFVLKFKSTQDKTSKEIAVNGMNLDNYNLDIKDDIVTLAKIKFPADKK